METGRRKRTRTERADSYWADLPPELLELIRRNLTNTFDYIHFRSVCSSWRLAVNRVLHPQLPLLRLPTTITFTEAREKLIYGSSHGWLLVMDCQPPNGFLVSLVNPITRAEVLLSPLGTDWGKFIPVKAIICSHPASPPKPGQIQVSIWTFQRLAFFRDQEWVVVKDFKEKDILYFEEELYFVDCLGRLSVFQADSLKVRLLMDKHVHMYHGSPTVCFRLVEADGDILLLQWNSTFLNVYKLDRRKQGEWMWVKMGVVDLTVFVCWVMSVCARGLPDHGGYEIYVSCKILNGKGQTKIIQVVNAVPGNGIDQTYRVWLQRQAYKLNLF